MDYQRQLLAELMNPLIPSAKKDYRDNDVCKHFLVGFCPNELFLNTKVDLGKCGNLHDERLQKEYQSSSNKNRLGYEDRFYDYLAKLVSDIERTIKRGHTRLESKPTEASPTGVTQDDIREKIIIIEETIKNKTNQLRQLGESGRVKDAYDLYSAVERSMVELDQLRQTDQTHPSYRPDKKMEKNGGTLRHYGSGNTLSNRDYRDRDRDRDGRRDRDYRGGRRESGSDRKGSSSSIGRGSDSGSYRDGRRY
ncbi:hypothetical protein BDEG_25250 [Batrachochytrium dendrobatidis JEL423]|uniref:Uncharacterized protein n=1 Tax=Batrachochytrium dendrobatidis (strain JEL423) TaxID=403673 RepID=A0A177WQJ8_BATDL|nr:hypothetical protein BDEG_25250 [Batrachochytrium dendrobatidis JEL423]